MNVIGENIKRLRIEKGYTQEKLGSLCTPKMAGSAIRRYENGGAIPKFETIIKIAKALGVPSHAINPELNEVMAFDTPEEFDKAYKKLVNNSRMQKMNTLMEELNDKGQEKAMEQVEMLTKIPDYQKDKEYSPHN